MEREHGMYQDCTVILRVPLQDFVGVNSVGVIFRHGKLSDMKMIECVQDS